ncbi:MAG TPA: hypothetical protein DHW82_05650 [Spirochaetia bacterium]|nr:hypothetical protein [Spirochaetia bacterium]
MNLIKKILNPKTLLEFKKFFIIGFSAFLIDLAVYYLFTLFFSLYLSKIISFLFATAFTYYFNKNWTFQQKGFSQKELFKFILFYIVSANINGLVNQWVFDLTHIKFLAFLSATGFNMIINFIGLKLIVFKKQSTQEGLPMNNEKKRFFFQDLKNRDHLALFILLITTVAIRIISMQMIQDGGDSVNAWHFAKKLLYGAPYEFGHIPARFSMIIPALMTQFVFGTHPLVYYIAPVLASIGAAYFLFKTGLKFSNRNTAFFSALFLMIFPEIVVASSHLKPEIFSVFYISASFYFLLVFLDRSKYSFLLLSGLFFFLAYLSKIDNLFFFPGFALTLLFKSEKKWKTLLIFGSTLLFFILIETLFYALLSPFPLGRVQVILGSHLSSGNFDLKEFSSFFDLLKRFEHVMGFWKLLLLLSLISSLFLLIKKDLRKKYASLLLIVSGFYFFITFTVKGFHPIKLAIPFEQRYLTASSPFLILLVISAVYEFFKLLFENKILKPLSKPLSHFKLFYLLFSFLILSGFSAGYISEYLRYYPAESRNYFKLHPLYLVPLYSRMSEEAYEKGIPVVNKKEIAERFRQTVEPVQKLLEEGFTLKEALNQLNLSETIYKAGLVRFESGDFKPSTVFSYAFIPDRFLLQTGKLLFPELKKVRIGIDEIGIMMNEKKSNDFQTTKETILNHPDQKVLFLEGSLFKMKWASFKEVFGL